VTGNIEQARMEGKGKTSESLANKGQGIAGNWNIDLLLEVELPLSVSFGSSEMQLKDVLKLGARPMS